MNFSAFFVALLVAPLSVFASDATVDRRGLELDCAKLLLMPDLDQGVGKFKDLSDEDLKQLHDRLLSDDSGLCLQNPHEILKDDYLHYNSITDRLLTEASLAIKGFLDSKKVAVFDDGIIKARLVNDHIPPLKLAVIRDYNNLAAEECTRDLSDGALRAKHASEASRNYHVKMAELLKSGATIDSLYRKIYPVSAAATEQKDATQQAAAGTETEGEEEEVTEEAGDAGKGKEAAADSAADSGKEKVKQGTSSSPSLTKTSSFNTLLITSSVVVVIVAFSLLMLYKLHATNDADEVELV